MKEIISSSITNLEFHRYFNRILSDFSPSEKTSERDYEPRECNLLFIVRDFSCNYALVFEKNQFFFKVNFEIEDIKHIGLRNRFYEKLNFLISDHRLFSRDENSIVLKSKINKKLIERAQIIFATERWMKSFFFQETKDAMEEIVSMVFKEFKETMSLVWKIIIENFEMITPLKCFVKKSDQICKDEEFDDSEKNPYYLSPMIKFKFESYHQQKLENISNEEIVPKKRKNWLKRIYIFMKKFKNKNN